MLIQSAHIHNGCGAGDALHQGPDVQLHTDHWDTTQKPDILHHAGPFCQLYTLNFENVNLAPDHRQGDNVMFGLCTGVGVQMSRGERQIARKEGLSLNNSQTVEKNGGY